MLGAVVNPESLDERLRKLATCLDEMGDALNRARNLVNNKTQPEPTLESYRAEYAAQISVLNSRYSSMMTLNSIVILGVVSVLVFAVTYATKVGKDPYYQLDTAGWVTFFAVFLAAVAWTNSNSFRVLNDASQDRMSEIEDALKIESIANPPSISRGGKIWRKAGVYSWPILYELFIISALLTTLDLWWESTARNWVLALLFLEPSAVFAVIVLPIVLPIVWKWYKKKKNKEEEAGRSTAQ